MNELQIGKASHIASLIIRRMQNDLSDEERAELESWLQEDGENYLLYEELMDQERLGAALDEMHTMSHDDAFEKLSQKLSLRNDSPKRIHPKIWWYMVAALLIVVAGVMWYKRTGQAPSKMPPPLVTAEPKQTGAKPDNEKAILLLADSTRIELDGIRNGAIAQQGNSVVTKNKHGELTYAVTGKGDYEMAYNTIQIPRGGEYKVVLDDGTKIWLNAASTLRFPVQFKGDERRVLLTGEAYFEVASNISKQTGQKKTFIVHVNDMDVQAIGTAFNISAYKEDEYSQTTVVEGLVKVRHQQKDELLPPGKKLVWHNDEFAVEDADVKQETAWKNGQFVFRNTSLQDVMNELARWYDIDIAYKDKMPSLHFSGEIQRQATIHRVLEMLEMTGGVSFTINDRQITVHPASSF